MRSKRPARTALALLCVVVGLLAPLGVWTGKQWLAWPAFVFAALVPLGNFRPDERFRANVARAGRNAYGVTILAVAVIMAVLHFYPTYEVAVNGLMGLFFAALAVFQLSLIYLERRGA